MNCALCDDANIWLRSGEFCHCVLCYSCVVDFYLLYSNLRRPPVLIPQACVNSNVHFYIAQVFSLGQVATPYWESEYPF